MDRYSSVYTLKGYTQSGYRYNYAYGTLEYVSKAISFRGCSNKPATLQFIDWVVIGSVGLSLKEWAANPRHCVERYSGNPEHTGRTAHRYRSSLTA